MRAEWSCWWNRRRIPSALAPSTVQTPAFEQLQILQQRLLTRSHLLDIARQFDVLPDLDNMNPDEIVSAMRARTKMETSNRRLAEAPLMTVTFEAPPPRLAARVLNEYLTQIQEDDVEYRKGRAGQTQDFFEQEVSRLDAELEQVGVEILEFKNANAEALPDRS